MTGEKNYLQLTEKKNNTTSMFFIFVYISQCFILLRAFLALREISTEGARNI